jgi:heme exporter protein CcmD
MLNSMNNFFLMGKYDAYIWASFGLTFLCFAIEIFIVKSHLDGLKNQ